jgi:hypothetical protein
MGYRWKPSKSQRRAFAERMKDPAEQQAYEARKTDKATKRRAGSKFDYASAGGEYLPTKQQHDFALTYMQSGNTLTSEQEDALNQVMYGYSCQEKVHHDSIHVCNELMRAQTVN